MAAISWTMFSNAFSWMKSFVLWLEFHCQDLFAKGLIDNKPALVEVMTWCRTGDKPLTEPMLTQFADAYMWHKR